MSLRVSVSAENIGRVSCDVLILPVVSGGVLPMAMSPSRQKELKARMRKLGYKGDWGTTNLLALSGRGWPCSFVGLVGLGDKDGGSERMAEGMRRGVGQLVQNIRQYGLRTIAVNLRNQETGVATEELATAAFEGAALAGYQFIEYSQRLRRQQRQRGIHRLLVLTDIGQQAKVRLVLREARQIMEGVELARGLVNKPAEDVTPKMLLEQAKALEKESARIKVKALGRREAGRAGLNAFLAVARGSSQEPYVIHLKYLPEQHSEQTKKVWLVGKGITFDSGGLSIKPADSMESMKDDMAGAATVLGVFAVLDKVNPSVEVHGVIAACENMPSGTSYRPGDILTAKGGKTIEVINTDAEGRITLADSLAYAAEQKPDAIVDVATLTGACVVALGSTVAGLLGNNDDLKRKLKAAAKRTGESMAELPMPDEYHSWIESPVADVSNMSSVKAGGVITAAMFLSEFVGDVPWAHLDVAGPAFAERMTLPYYGRGATGYGVRTLVEFLKKFD